MHSVMIEAGSVRSRRNPVKDLAREASVPKSVDVESSLLRSVELGDTPRGRFVAAMMAGEYEAARQLYESAVVTSDDVDATINVEIEQTDESAAREKKPSQPYNPTQQANYDALLATYRQQYTAWIYRLRAIYHQSRFGKVGDVKYLAEEAMENAVISMTKWVGTHPAAEAIGSPEAFFWEIVNNKMVDLIRKETNSPLRYDDPRKIDNLAEESAVVGHHEKSNQRIVGEIENIEPSPEEILLKKDRFVLAHVLYGLLIEGGTLDGKRIGVDFEPTAKKNLDRNIRIIKERLHGVTAPEIGIQLMREDILPGDPNSIIDIRRAEQIILKSTERLLQKYRAVLGVDEPATSVSFEGRTNVGAKAKK